MGVQTCSSTTITRPLSDTSTAKESKSYQNTSTVKNEVRRRRDGGGGGGDGGNGGSRGGRGGGGGDDGSPSGEGLDAYKS